MKALEVQLLVSRIESTARGNAFAHGFRSVCEKVTGERLLLGISEALNRNSVPWEWMAFSPGFDKDREWYFYTPRQEGAPYDIELVTPPVSTTDLCPAGSLSPFFSPLNQLPDAFARWDLVQSSTWIVLYRLERLEPELEYLLSGWILLGCANEIAGDSEGVIANAVEATHALLRDKLRLAVSADPALTRLYSLLDPFGQDVRLGELQSQGIAQGVSLLRNSGFSEVDEPPTLVEEPTETIIGDGWYSAGENAEKVKNAFLEMCRQSGPEPAQVQMAKASEGWVTHTRVNVPVHGLAEVSSSELWLVKVCGQIEDFCRFAGKLLTEMAKVPPKIQKVVVCVVAPRSAAEILKRMAPIGHGYFSLLILTIEPA